MSSWCSEVLRTVTRSAGDGRILLWSTRKLVRFRYICALAATEKPTYQVTKYHNKAACSHWKRCCDVREGTPLVCSQSKLNICSESVCANSNSPKSMVSSE